MVWTSNSLVVAVCVVFELHNKGSMYGPTAYRTCSIVTLYGEIVFSNAPSIILLISSSACLVYTLYKLHERREELVAKRELITWVVHQQILVMCLQLISVFVCVEVVEGVGLVGGGWLRVVHHVVKSLKGVALFLIYVMKRNVLRRLRNVFAGGGRDDFDGETFKETDISDDKMIIIIM